MLAAHFHDTFDTAIENILTAVSYGILLWIFRLQNCGFFGWRAGRLSLFDETGGKRVYVECGVCIGVGRIENGGGYKKSGGNWCGDMRNIEQAISIGGMIPNISSNIKVKFHLSLKVLLIHLQ